MSKLEKFWSNTPSFADEHKVKSVDNTHPVKQLSDDEIEKHLDKYFNGTYKSLLETVRAIIKEITE